MPQTSTPTDVASGVIVRARVAGAGTFYDSPRMTLRSAEQLATEVADAVARYESNTWGFPDDGTDPLIDFPSPRHEGLRLRLDRIVALEVLRVDREVKVSQLLNEAGAR